MNKNIDSALNDVILIKDAIKQSRGTYKEFCKLICFYGIYKFCLFISQFLPLSYQMSPHAPFIKLGANFLISLIFLLYFMNTYKKEKERSNKYYLGYMAIWGMLVFILPFLLLACRIFLILSSSTFDSVQGIEILLNLNYSSMLIDIIMLSICFIVCSFILQKNYLCVLSITILFFYILLTTVYKSSSFSLLLFNDPITITISSLYYIFTISTGYLFLGFYLQHKGGKNGYN